MKLVAIDFDGTLLSADGTISEKNREAIIDCQRAGIVVAICSGRSLHDTKELLKRAGLDCPVITGNGALAFHGEELIQKLIMSESVLMELLPWLDERGYYYELYTNQGVYVLNSGKDMLDREIGTVSDDPSFSASWAENERDIQFKQYGIQFMDTYKELQIAELDIYKIFVLSFHRDKLQLLRDRLKDRKDLSVTTSGWTKVEIAHEKANKGSGLASLAAYLHIPLEETVAIGDNFNDVPMFEVAGMSIAMENGDPEVKKQVDYITRSNNEDGVAFALYKYVLKP
ncbi:Cof-type HAD-IIB family hydrolase [Bacillus testis]|uniref:Cof-type HAD-IIB family hydrolase n=1 Tax=Bacillus testis TaxID=1622072 RepID=UPI00067F019F|nr:Cof-type HAD-IIB family hydrolase [Bacillus testis]